MNLTEEQQLVMKESVKVYLVNDLRMGKVEKVTSEMVTVNIGTTKEPARIKFSPDEYKDKILKDEIVLQRRVIWGKNHQYAGVKPLDNPPVVEVVKNEHKITPAVPSKTPDVLSPIPYPEIGYINVKSGRFRLTPKEGYVRIEYKEVETQRVSLDLTDEQIKLLEEMGIKKG